MPTPLSESTNMTLDALRREVAPYGLYFTYAKAPPGEQFLGGLEVLLIALAVLGWSLKEFLKAYLQESGKRLAAMTFDASEKEEDLRAKIAALEQEVQQCQDAVSSTSSVDVEVILGQMGIPRSRAKELSPKLGPILTAYFKRLVEKQ